MARFSPSSSLPSLEQKGLPIKDKGHYEGVTDRYEAWQTNKRKIVIDTLREVVERVEVTSFEQPNQWVEKTTKLEQKNRLLE